MPTFWGCRRRRREPCLRSSQLCLLPERGWEPSGRQLPPLNTPNITAHDRPSLRDPPTPAQLKDSRAQGILPFVLSAVRCPQSGVQGADGSVAGKNRTGTFIMSGIHDKKQLTPPDSGALMTQHGLHFQPKSNSSALVLSNKWSKWIFFPPSNSKNNSANATFQVLSTCLDWAPCPGFIVGSGLALTPALGGR